MPERYFCRIESVSTIRILTYSPQRYSPRDEPAYTYIVGLYCLYVGLQHRANQRTSSPCTGDEQTLIHVSNYGRHTCCNLVYLSAYNMHAAHSCRYRNKTFICTAQHYAYTTTWNRFSQQSLDSNNAALRVPCRTMSRFQRHHDVTSCRRPTHNKVDGTSLAHAELMAII